MKKINLGNGLEIVSMSAAGTSGNARLRLRAPVMANGIKADAGLEVRLKEVGAASLFFDMKVPGQQKQDNFNYQNIGDVLPKEGDFITLPFRALSKRIVPGHWIDFTKGDVLKNSTELLLGQTVYPNHDLFDINNALGSVAAVEWDETGALSEGVSGINAQYKIDALMNPRLARLLLMKPPAIHSTSLTFLFDFEFSHPKLAEEGKFWMMRGEDVDGEIVRLIVTEINEYWEASLVFQGADRLAKQYDEGDETDLAGLSAEAAEDTPEPPNSNEEKTMKLSAEQKTKLGIEFDGEDVPETEIFKSAESLADKLAAVDTVNIEQLSKRAEAGDVLVEEKRSEVTRLARLAELGAETGELPAVVSDDIKGAGVERLRQLGDYYGKKVAERFPKDGRSSLEDGKEVENAGGVDDKTETELPEVGLL